MDLSFFEESVIIQGLVHLVSNSFSFTTVRQSTSCRATESSHLPQTLRIYDLF